jgi:hypothetical protein
MLWDQMALAATKLVDQVLLLLESHLVGQSQSRLQISGNSLQLQLQHCLQDLYCRDSQCYPTRRSEGSV